MAILYNVVSNDTQRFTFANTSFFCRPYGIVTLEELYDNAQNNPTCQEAIKKFYKRKPLLQYFSSNLLELQQMYHVVLQEKRCVVYAKGETTLSELLIRNGLAFIKPFFENEEFLYLFKKAQNNAKYEKIGLWGEPIVVACFASLYGSGD